MAAYLCSNGCLPPPKVAYPCPVNEDTKDTYSYKKQKTEAEKKDRHEKKNTKIMMIHDSERKFKQKEDETDGRTATL